MKKHLALLMTLLLAASALAGCGAKQAETPAPTPAPAETTTETAKWADGMYYAQGDTYDAKTGWKSTVLLEVKDGKIVSANWNGISNKIGVDKKTASQTGKYPMVEKGGAKAPWHEQAAEMEKFLIEKQDPKAITVNAEGKTDAVSSVTMAVGDFALLADKALTAGPATAGTYKDGTYHAEGKDFDAKTGWKGTMDIVIANGNIISVFWSGVDKDGNDKKTASIEGKYPMVEKGGAKAPWHEQAAAAEGFLLEKQAADGIAVNAEGKTDAIASVTMAVGEFTQLATEALSAAK